MANNKFSLILLGIFTFLSFNTFAQDTGGI